MAFVARGVAFILSGGNVVGGLPRWMRDLGNEALMYVVGGEGGGLFLLQQARSEPATALQRMDRVFQWPVVVTAITVADRDVRCSHRTQFGRHTYAIGGNREASLRAGVPVGPHDRSCCSSCRRSRRAWRAAFTPRGSRAAPSIAGEPLLLSSIAAVIIGGVSMFGGRGSVIGTVIGALIIAILVTGLVMLGVDPFWQFIVIGIVVILAVLIDQARDLIIGRAEYVTDEQPRSRRPTRSRRSRRGCRTDWSARPPGPPMLSVREDWSSASAASPRSTTSSLDVDAGEVVGLVGDNGAGKSTLIKCVSGVHQADEGEIVVRRRQAVRFAQPDRRPPRRASRRSTRTSRSRATST